MQPGAPYQPPHAGGPPPYPQAAPRTPIPGQNLAIGLLVAAAAIAVAAISKSWATWSEGGGEHGGFGLSGAEFCGDGGFCMPVPTEALESSRVGLPSDVSIWGTLGLITAIATLAGAGAVGVMMLMRKPQSIHKLTKPTLLAGGAAGFFCTFYLIRLLSATMRIKPGPSWAGFIGIGGLIAVGVLIQRVQKMTAFAGGQFALPPGGVPYGAYGGAPGAPGPYGAAPGAPMAAPGAPGAPGAPMAAAPAPAAAPTHPCPRCQRPLVFVAQYQRWFCESCRQYA